MTSTTSGGADLEHAVIREILHTLAERQMTVRSIQSTFQALPKEKTGNQEGWLEFVVREVADLPWYESNLPDGRTPPQPRAAVGLISLLATTLGRDTITPSSVNTTWSGGVAVEWHIGGIDLEIACQLRRGREDPGGPHQPEHRHSGHQGGDRHHRRQRRGQVLPPDDAGQRCLPG